MFFIWKDLKVQYQNPALGLIWSVFQPLVYFGIILLVMNVAGRSSNDVGIPFSLYLISGLAIWNFVTSAILGAVNSIQSNTGIISKAFFPRFYLILSPIIKSVIDLLIMLLLVFGIAVWIGQFISVSVLIAIPISIVSALLAVVGVSSIVASLVVKNRQVRHAIPILLYAMLFALPVFYSMHTMGNPIMDWLYRLNPIAGSMEMLRAGFGAEMDMQMVAGWFMQAIVLFVIGVMSFRLTERKLADLV